MAGASQKPWRTHILSHSLSLSLSHTYTHPLAPVRARPHTQSLIHTLAGSRLLTSQPGTPSQHLTRISPAAAEIQGSSTSSFQRRRRILCRGPTPSTRPTRSPARPESRGSVREGRSGRKWRRLEKKKSIDLLSSPPPPRLQTHGHSLRDAGPGARKGAGSGGRAARRDARTPGPGRRALTAAARPRSRAAQAWPPPEPAGRGGKKRPEPSGSLPWDTSCSALGLGRSPHLSGSLPRPPAEFPEGAPECRLRKDGSRSRGGTPELGRPRRGAQEGSSFQNPLCAPGRARTPFHTPMAGPPPRPAKTPPKAQATAAREGGGAEKPDTALAARVLILGAQPVPCLGRR
ncbi:protein SPT2 homolog [Dasypus novemcinctus]|uniref:protein SPT2 homolog n=1 Tax=Dasypus novemcinctus TaxID=9361 RepID=UPI00266007F6|nr:protein SPT2 homolog [Dasypus novemcinctus]